MDPTLGKRNVAVISLAFFCIFFGFGTGQQYLVILFNQQGRGHLALVSLFLLYGAFLATGIFISKIIPFLGGLKKSLLIGAFFYAAFLASVAFNYTPLLFIASIMVGISAGLLWVSSGQIIADSSSERTTGRNFALQKIGLYGGNILGVYTGAYLFSTFSFEYSYFLLAGSVVVGLFLLLFVMPLKEEILPRPFRPYFVFDTRMLALLPLIFGANYFQGQVFTAVNGVVVHALGIRFIPLVFSAIMVSNGIGSFASGSASGWMNKRSLLCALAITAFCGVVIFIGSSTLIPILTGAILLGLSISATYPVCLAWLKEKLPAEEYLYALGTFHVYSNIGVVAAILANIWLPTSTIFLPGIVALVVALPGILLFQKIAES